MWRSGHENQLDSTRTSALEPTAVVCASDQCLWWNPDLDPADPRDLVFRNDVQGSSEGGQNDKESFKPVRPRSQ